MEEKGGLKGNTFDGVFFSEQPVPSAAKSVGHISVEISRQNSNLFEVKTRMAEEARARGANTIADFTYGQRAHRGLKLLALKWDTESWHGEGEAIVL